MKDYIQVSESVFRKAELRIAENKRRSTIIKRNTIAASGAAAILITGMWQNEGIRNAITSIPELASKRWSHETETSSTTTAPLPETTTATETTVTETTTTSTTTEQITTEKTSTSTTTTTTAETTTTTETTTAPVVTTLSWLDSLPQFNMGCGRDDVVSATDELLEFESGMRVNIAYCDRDLKDVFHKDDSIQYDGNFAYDDDADMYYFLNGSFHLWDIGRYSEDYVPPEDEEEEEPPKPIQEDFPTNERGEKLYYFPWLYLDLNESTLEYSFIKESKNFKLKEQQDYRVHVSGVKIKSFRSYRLVTEDGQVWYFNSGNVFGLTPEEFEGLSVGDTIEFVGYIIHNTRDSSYSVMEAKFENVIKNENPSDELNYDPYWDDWRYGWGDEEDDPYNEDEDYSEYDDEYDSYNEDEDYPEYDDEYDPYNEYEDYSEYDDEYDPYNEYEDYPEYDDEYDSYNEDEDYPEYDDEYDPYNEYEDYPEYDDEYDPYNENEDYPEYDDECDSYNEDEDYPEYDDEYDPYNENEDYPEYYEEDKPEDE